MHDVPARVDVGDFIGDEFDHVEQRSDDEDDLVAGTWLGNSPDIAREHYLQVTDQHFERATKAAQKAAQYTPVSSMYDEVLKPATPENPDEYVTLRERTSVETDGEGFEPPVRFPVRQFSRLLP